MNRTFTRRLLLSSLVVAGGAASASACTSSDPTLPPEQNPVVVTANAPPPISGGTLLVTNGIAVAADSDRDLVWLVDLTTKAVTSVTLKAGDEPGRLAVDGAGPLVGQRKLVRIESLERSSGRATLVDGPPEGESRGDDDEALESGSRRRGRRGGRRRSRAGAGSGPSETQE